VVWADSGVVVCSATGSQQDPSVVSDGSGGAFIAWTDYRSNAGGDAYFEHILADGTVAPGWPVDGRPIATGATEYNYGVRLISDGAGGVIAAWKYTKLRLQRYAANGDSLWGPTWLQLGFAETFSVATDGYGGIIALTKYGGINADLFAQRVSNAGSLLWSSSGIAVSTAPGLQNWGVLACDSSGGAIAAWEDGRTEGSGANAGDIYAQNINADGSLGGSVVAALVSLASADAQSDRVALRWFTTDRSLASADVERNADNAGWVGVGAVSLDGDGMLTFADSSVQPAHRYGYRLRSSSGATLGEVWVTTPSSAEFALRGAQPNPADREPVIAFALPDDRRATLELFDVTGRRLGSREVGTLGAGNHSLRLSELGSLRAGMYLVRLTRGARIQSARFVVTD
jgi:hypothetical protein